MLVHPLTSFSELHLHPVVAEEGHSSEEGLPHVELSAFAPDVEGRSGIVARGGGGGGGEGGLWRLIRTKIVICTSERSQ